MDGGIVLLDVDGVLADFVGYYLEVVNDCLGTHYTYEDLNDYSLAKSLKLSDRNIRDINAVIAGVRMARHVHPLPGSREGYQLLAQVCLPVFCTSYLEICPTWVYDRTRWLNTHFYGRGRETVFTKLKYLVQGRMLIDDMPYNVEKWMRVWPDGVGVLWRHRYNERFCPKGAVLTNSWEEVRSLITNGK